MIKKILLGLCAIIGAIVLFLILTAHTVYNKIPISDDMLAQAEIYFQPKPIKLPERNGFYIMFGLDAPEVIGTDIYEWSENIIVSYIAKINSFDKNDTDFYDKIDNIEIQNKMTFNGNLAGVECLIYPMQNTSKSHPCMSPQQARELIESNRLLLDRYRLLMQYERYVPTPYLDGVRPLQINAHILFLTDLVLHMKDDPESAVKDWIKHTRFLRNALADEKGTFSLIGLMLNYHMSQKIVPILFSDSTIVRQYHQEILELTRPLHAQNIHIDALMQAHHTWQMPLSLKLSSKSQAVFISHIQDFKALASVDPQNYATSYSVYKNRYAPISWYTTGVIGVLTRISYMLYDNEKISSYYLVRQGSYIADAAFPFMHKANAYNRFLSAYLHLRLHGEPNESMANTAGDFTWRPDSMGAHDPALYDADEEVFTLDRKNGILKYRNEPFDITFQAHYR